MHLNWLYLNNKRFKQSKLEVILFDLSSFPDEPDQNCNELWLNLIWLGIHMLCSTSLLLEELINILIEPKSWRIAFYL